MNIELEAFSKPCECGREHKIDVRRIVIESGAIQQLPHILTECGCAGRKPMLVCDSNTHFAAQKIEALLPDSETILLSADNLHADEHAVSQIEAAIERYASQPLVLLAVGSGTIHDAVRYVAHQKGMPFVSVPTAVSVDGFVSTVAAMTWNGFKVTFPASAPVAVVADSDIFSAAPYRLTASGVSDLLGKYTALLDWMVSHLVTGEYYCDRVAEMMRSALEVVVQNIDRVRMQDRESCEQLMYALLLSGLAMQMVGNSRPASGAEHHMSHLWEMNVLSPALNALHGEKVGVALVLVCERYKRFAAGGDIKLTDYTGMPSEALQEVFGELYGGVEKENTPDILLAVDSKRLACALPAIRGLCAALPDGEEVRNLLRRAGAKTELHEIGLSERIIPQSLTYSPFVRCRLTLMRLFHRMQEKAGERIARF